jgi:renalase
VSGFTFVNSALKSEPRALFLSGDGLASMRICYDESLTKEVDWLIRLVDAGGANHKPSGAIAVVGAGLAGLVCARVLQGHLQPVALFDKARRPGGRCATRLSRSNSQWQLDHGLPYFAGEAPGFRTWLEHLETQNILSRWSPRYVEGPADQLLPKQQEYWVGNPVNSAVAEHLARPLTIALNTRIEAVNTSKGQWYLHTDTARHGPFDTLIATLPTAQLTALFPHLEGESLEVEFEPAHALMLGFESPLPINWDAARLTHPVLSWACRESAKPHRAAAEQWVIHSTASWSRAHLERPLDEVKHTLLAAFLSLVPAPVAPVQMQLHRWRYAQTGGASRQGALWDPDARLGICADWLGGGGAQGAVLSGAQLAWQVLQERR